MSANSPPPMPGPPKSPEKQAPPKKPRAGIATLIIHHSVTVLILVLFVGVGIWGYLTFQSTDFFATVDRAEFEAQIRPPLVEAQRQRIETALHVSNHLHTRYPGRLEELVDMGLLLESDLFYPRAPEEWVYARRGDEFSLERRLPGDVE